MFALRKRFEDDYFEIIEATTWDVETLLSAGVALFNSKTHALYAQATLCAISPPFWKPNFQRHGYIVTPDEPLFCPHDDVFFAKKWLSLMCQETRLHLARMKVTGMVFNLIPQDPAPGPWAIIKSASTQEYFVVDSEGRVVGAQGKDKLEQSITVTFANEILLRDGKHLDLIETY